MLVRRVGVTATPIVATADAAEDGAGAAAAPRVPLVAVRGLKKHFPIYGGLLRRQIGTVYAVDGVDFDVYPGEIFSLVGESGCGKTTLGRTLLQLTPADGAARSCSTATTLADVDPDDMRPLRRRMQIIFQDPFGSLNPRMPVSDIIGEGLLAQGMTDRKDARQEGRGLARDRRACGATTPGAIRTSSRAASASGSGSPGRSPWARTSSSATSRCRALDVSIQSQVLNLLLDLRRDFNLTYLFISHNLSVVQYFSDRVGVMYLGKIVEIGTVEQLYRDPRHPYTVALLSAIPDAGSAPPQEAPRPQGRRAVAGRARRRAAGSTPAAGCARSSAIPSAASTEEPELRATSASGHQTACHFAEEISDQAVAQVVGDPVGPGDRGRRARVRLRSAARRGWRASGRSTGPPPGRPRMRRPARGLRSRRQPAERLHRGLSGSSAPRRLRPGSPSRAGRVARSPRSWLSGLPTRHRRSPRRRPGGSGEADLQGDVGRRGRAREDRRGPPCRTSTGSTTYGPTKPLAAKYAPRSAGDRRRAKKVRDAITAGDAATVSSGQPGPDRRPRDVLRAPERAGGLGRPVRVQQKTLLQ